MVTSEDNDRVRRLITTSPEQCDLIVYAGPRQRVPVTGVKGQS